ncbi:MAG: thermonuclease family protein [Rhodothalassiaceae bacterium]
MIGLRGGALALLLGLSIAARAGPAGTVQVAATPDGESVALADGRIVRLAAVRVPRPEAPDDTLGEALARAAREALHGLAAGRRCSLDLVAPAPDRYGRLVAALDCAPDPGDLAAAMVRGGHVLVFPGAGEAEVAAPLYASEEAARAARRGLWASGRYDVEAAAAVDAPPGRLVIVRGRVVAAARVEGFLYLNFGADWRRDFTVRLTGPVRRRLPKAARAAAWWRGRLVEVRGLLQRENGLLIEPGDPAQLRLPGDAAKEKPAPQPAPVQN